MTCRFDGVEGNKMIDRKRAITMTEKTRKQARRQSAALRQNGLEGVWEVPTDAQAARAEKLLSDERISNITVKVVKP